MCETNFILRIDGGNNGPGSNVPVFTVHSTIAEAEEALTEYVLGKLAGVVEGGVDGLSVTGDDGEEEDLVKRWFDRSGERWEIAGVKVKGAKGD